MQVALNTYMQVALNTAGSPKYMQVYVCTDKTACECALQGPAVCSVEEQGEVRGEGEVHTKITASSYRYMQIHNAHYTLAKVGQVKKVNSNCFHYDR